jgi:hypothetical protein
VANILPVGGSILQLTGAAAASLQANGLQLLQREADISQPLLPHSSTQHSIKLRLLQQLLQTLKCLAH